MVIAVQKEVYLSTKTQASEERPSCLLAKTGMVGANSRGKKKIILEDLKNYLEVAKRCKLHRGV